MKKQITKCIISAGLIMIFSGISSYSPAQNSGGPVTLAYKYPAGKSIRYLNNTTMAQIMDIQGQTMQTDVTSSFGCNIKSAGSQVTDQKLVITVDTIGQTTNSPMGVAGGSVQGVKGKSCSIIIAPTGKPVDLSEAAGLTYNIEGSGETNLTQILGDFFPLLPKNPVKPGDTWNMTDSVLTKSSAMTMKTIDFSINKLEGLENVNGIECAKISAQHSGTMTMTVQNQGMDIFIKGPYTGTSECLFAIKEGYFVRNTNVTKLTGNIDITTPESMSFPLVIDMKSVNEMK